MRQLGGRLRGRCNLSLADRGERRSADTDRHEREVAAREARALEHRDHADLPTAAESRFADRLALEVGQRLDRAIVEHAQTEHVLRILAEEELQAQPLRVSEDQRLDRARSDVGLAARRQLRRRRGPGDVLLMDDEVLGFEEAGLVGNVVEHLEEAARARSADHAERVVRECRPRRDGEGEDGARCHGEAAQGAGKGFRHEESFSGKRVPVERLALRDDFSDFLSISESREPARLWCPV